MSTSYRLISGSASSWARIAITLITQVALVPIYLTYWNVETFGLWIAIQALANILSTLDRGYVEYLGYEFLKAGSSSKEKIKDYLWAGIRVTIIVGLIELILIFFLAFSSKLSLLFGENSFSQNSILLQSGWVLILQWFGFTFCANTSGLFFRALTVYGYYPRMGWWNVLITIVSSLAPVVAVIFKANLLEAGIAATAGLLLVSLFQFLDIFKLLKRVNLTYKRVSLKLGFESYKISLIVSGKFFLENFRQQGVRLILAPLVGMSSLTQFSTIRTTANVAQQGLLTISQPLLPELMRFIKNKDQPKTEIAFDTIWLVVVTLLAPAIILFQAAAEPLFLVWTKGQVTFNPLLFGLLSLGVIVFAAAQPATAIVIGNNLLRTQIVVSFITSVIVLGGIVLLLPMLGIASAGISLLLAEIVAAVSFQQVTKRWLLKNNLVWPQKQANITAVSVLIAAISILLIILLPTLKWITVIISLCLLTWNMIRYWKNMSAVALQKTKEVLVRIPVVNKLILVNIGN